MPEPKTGQWPWERDPEAWQRAIDEVKAVAKADEEAARIEEAKETMPWTEEDVRHIIANPIHTGIGPFPPMIDDSLWIKAAVNAMKEVGPEAFLVDLLYCLRLSFGRWEED